MELAPEFHYLYIHLYILGELPLTFWRGLANGCPLSSGQSNFWNSTVIHPPHMNSLEKWSCEVHGLDAIGLAGLQLLTLSNLVLPFDVKYRT